MLTVYKYTLAPEHQAILMPDNAKVLSAAEQKGEVVLYALVDTDEPVVAREFYVTGTGHEVALQGDSLLGSFVGTVVIDGWMMFHVFEVTT